LFLAANGFFGCLIDFEDSLPWVQAFKTQKGLFNLLGEHG